STIASTKLRLMVGPMWMSLIWAIVKPSSGAGRSVSGTSTSTTRATRRAMKNPTAVMTGVSAMTPMAEMRIQDSCSCGDSASTDNHKCARSRPRGPVCRRSALGRLQVAGIEGSNVLLEPCAPGVLRHRCDCALEILPAHAPCPIGQLGHLHAGERPQPELLD